MMYAVTGGRMENNMKKISLFISVILIIQTLSALVFAQTSDEMGIKMYFSDFDTSFYLLEYNADIYIIGINTNNKKISHLRYVLKKDFYK